MVPSSITISGIDMTFDEIFGKYVELQSIPRSWVTVEVNNSIIKNRIKTVLRAWIKQTIPMEGRYCVHVGPSELVKAGKAAGYKQRVYVSFESDNDAMMFVLLDGKTVSLSIGD